MIEPNKNFESEHQELWNSKHYENRALAKLLYVKKKLITKIEYDIVLWVICNLSKKSEVRKGVIANLYYLKSIAELKEIKEQQQQLEL